MEQKSEARSLALVRGFRHMASGTIHFSPDAGLNRGLVKSEGSPLQPVTGLELLGFWRKFLRESGLERYKPSRAEKATLQAGGIVLDVGISGSPSLQRASLGQHSQGDQSVLEVRR